METDNNNNIDYSNNVNVDGKKHGKGAKILTAFLALLLVASLAGVYFLFQDSDTAKAGLKSANGQIAELQKNVNDLRIQLDTTKLNLRKEKNMREQLELENDTLKTLLPIYISELEVANADGRGNTISAYGKPISASSSMYLMPRIKYWGLRAGIKVELMVRLYNNEGKLVTGSTSPAGYSYSYKIDPLLPNENTLSLSGWGGADRGHFKPGTYRYEVWYGDMCLRQKVFILK